MVFMQSFFLLIKFNIRDNNDTINTTLFNTYAAATLDAIISNC